jgi:hypothetical protein
VVANCGKASSERETTCGMANQHACGTRVCHAARRINDAISWEKAIDFRLGRTSVICVCRELVISKRYLLSHLLFMYALFPLDAATRSWTDHLLRLAASISLPCRYFASKAL